LKKLFLIFTIIILVSITAIIKNTTKKIEDQIFAYKESVRVLKSDLANVRLEYDYLSSAEKLLEYQSLYFEDQLVQKKIEDIKIYNISCCNLKHRKFILKIIFGSIGFIYFSKILNNFSQFNLSLFSIECSKLLDCLIARSRLKVFCF